MSSRRVVNASPIIFLDRVGFLDQLNEPGVTVLVPDPVLKVRTASPELAVRA